MLFNAELENESDVGTWKTMKRNDPGIFLDIPVFGWRYKSHKISKPEYVPRIESRIFPIWSSKANQMD